MPKISAVLAAWNAQETIERCVESLLGYPDIEIIVVDDCSTDNTSTILQNLSARHTNVISLKTDRNAGPSAARNLGISISTGEWICIVDSDDTVAPTRLMEMLALAESAKADICFDNILVVDLNNDTQTPLLLPSEVKKLAAPWDIEIYTTYNKAYISPVLIGFLKPLIKKSFLDTHGITYNPEVRNSEDYLLILECLICGATTSLHPQPMYNYYIYRESLSATFRPEQREKFMKAEKEFLHKYQNKLSVEDRQFIEDHLKASESAHQTNKIFASISKKNYFDAVFLLLSDYKNIFIHADRIRKAALRKIMNKSNRGF